jgi:hypothetical protein
MPDIVLQSFGNIPRGVAANIKTVIEECYCKLEPHAVRLLDLLLFENQTRMNSYYASEKKAWDVASELLSERFFAVHDAWRGISRIGVCLENMSQLSELVQIGALRHEVGHSVLHGSVEHYVFSVTQPLLEAERRSRLGRGFSLSILYLISLAVKDFEVTRLLAEKGYVEDQLAYSSHVLAASEDDLTAWKMAEGNLAAEALCVASRLKDAAPTIAINQFLQRSSVERLKEELSYLPETTLERLLRLAEALSKCIIEETLHNVNSTVGSFVETILEPSHATL